MSTYVDFVNLGKVRNKFPLEMAEIHAPVIAADINDDGKIEMGSQLGSRHSDLPMKSTALEG